MSEQPQQSSRSGVEFERWFNDGVELLASLWAGRSVIGWTTATATVLAVVVSLLWPSSYRSAVTILPETEKSKLSAAGLSDLASLAGISVGGDASLPKMYPTIMRSEAVLRNVVFAPYQTTEFAEPVNLIDYWEITGDDPERRFEDALRKLRQELELSTDSKTMVVTIEIEMYEPQLAADIANNVAAELDSFIRTKRTTSASEQRKWIERRLTDVRHELELAEDSLKIFRERNRSINDSPSLLLQQGRLLREVQINTQVYGELKKQHEIARIEEVKTLPIISILDHARPAARKSSPRRAFIVVTVFALSMLFSGAWVVAGHRIVAPVRSAWHRIVGRRTS